MNRFDILKTIQLGLLVLLAAAALFVIYRDPALYSMIAADPSVRALCLILWLVLGISFAFLFYDFSSYAGMKRQNSELDHAVYADALTGIANRYSVDMYIGEYLHKELPPDMGCVTFDLLSLREINEAHGHEAGDEAIQSFSEILTSAASGEGFIGRNGGNKFVVIFRECTPELLEHLAKGVEQKIKEHNEAHPDRNLRCSTGAAFREKDIHSLAELVALSDRRAERGNT